MEKKREPGYYWIKAKGWIVFEIGYWNGAKWMICSGAVFNGNDLSEIDERPITRDSQPPRV